MSLHISKKSMIVIFLVLSSLTLSGMLFVLVQSKGSFRYETESGNRIYQLDDGSYYTETEDGLIVPGRELRSFEEYQEWCINIRVDHTGIPDEECTHYNWGK